MRDETKAIFGVVVVSCAIGVIFYQAMFWLMRPAPYQPETLVCSGLGGHWGPVTVDIHGQPKMWACFDQEGYVIHDR